MSVKKYTKVENKRPKIKQNKLTTISMCRALSKLGVFHLLKSLEAKGGENVM